MVYERSLIEAAFVRMQRGQADWQDPETVDAVYRTIAQLDEGSLRVSSPVATGEWPTQSWIKSAILLYFRLRKCEIMTGNAMGYDKIPLKFAQWAESDFARARIRLAPPATVRYGAYIAPGAILMPSYVNIGAYVGADTLIDTWATVGSCVQVGARVHISGGVGLGGVLEPVQAQPTVIEDDCFIGARSEIVEGVVVERGSVLSMGVYLGKSTRIYHRESGAISYGRVPAYSVVVPGNLPASDGTHSVYAAIIVKTVDENTRRKVALNELLRDH